MIEPGIYPDLSNADYHADSAISRSGLMLFRQSPFKFKAEYLANPRPIKKSTPEMEFGSAFHTFVLEPKKFNQEYIVEPILEKLPKLVRLKDVGKPAFEIYKIDRAATENRNKQIMEDFAFYATNKKIISSDNFELLEAMYESLMNHSHAKDLIEGAAYEHSYFWEDAHSGLMVKCKPDALHPNIIVDLKTCKSADSRSYQRTMIESGYHIQGAMIREGVYQLTGNDIPNVINICIEKTYPYEIGIKIISESALEAGKQAFIEDLLALNTCLRDNAFASYPTEIVEMPTWGR